MYVFLFLGLVSVKYGKGKAFLPLWILMIAAGRSSFFALEAVCRKQRLCHTEFLHLSSQIIMASPSPTAHPAGSCDHSHALLPLPRRSTQVPVDQESGSRVWDLQLSRQGAFFSSWILWTLEGKLWVPGANVLWEQAAGLRWGFV